MREYRLGRIGKLEVTAVPIAVLGFILLWAAAGIIFLLLFTRALVPALLVGLAAAGLHYLAGLVHQLSHAAAAARTGFPMERTRFGRLLILATSIYPEDEPDLPTQVHLRRAIGGPVGSLALSAAALVLGIFVRPLSAPAAGLLFFLAADSLVIFAIGALIPLGFTDMSSILYYSRRR